MNEKVEIAILDDYQGVSLQSADWNIIKDRANVTVFREHIYDSAEIIEKLRKLDKNSKFEVVRTDGQLYVT